VALMRGPLMLVAINPPSKQIKLGADFLPSLKPMPFRPQTFESADPALPFRFAPFYTVRDESYTTYVETV
jgi:hypothetical protein